MTFRPTDDVLDSMENSQQGLEASNQYNQASNENMPNDLNGGTGSKIFSNLDAENDGGNVAENVATVGSSQAEEVKAPDLSELLDKSEESKNIGDIESDNNTTESSEDFTVDLSEIENNKKDKALDGDGQVSGEGAASQTEGGVNQEEDYIDSGKMPDKEREEIVSGMEGSIHSKMDFLVDGEWKSVVETYRKIYRIVFRRGVFIFVALLGVISGVIVQVKANQPGELQLVGDSTIGNISSWSESSSDKIKSSQISKDYDIEPIVSYGSVDFNDRVFKSKSNLIKYEGIILPQLAYLDFNSTDFISLDEFANKETSREDIENMVKNLITNDEMYLKTSSLPNALDSRWKGRNIAGGLIEGFGLGCVRSAKIGDFVCDKFLERFYKYGKYYDLSLYSSDVLNLARELNRQKKDIKPICTMVKEYVWHSGVTSADDILGSVINFCDANDFLSYKKMVKFIDIDNSLRQPELLDNVFDGYPELNAYKLLSAQQIVYKTLNSSSINENFIKSYLTFVQNLLNKDGGSNRYLDPIYKDILYVFNRDVLYDSLLKKGKESLVSSKLDLIDHGDDLLGYVSLTSQLTTPDIVKPDNTWVGDNGTDITLAEVFSKYYGMTDRLTIRKATELSDADMQVQTEIFSDTINKVTNGLTLKATILLHRKKNVLYVKSINISKQQSLSDALNIHAADGDVRFDAMLGYIDEQISFWYQDPEETEVEFTLCDRLEYMGDVDIYGCSDSSIVLYKGDVEYAFTLEDGVLDSFVISDSDLDSALKGMLSNVMTSRENTPTIIESIVDYELEKPTETHIEEKLDIIDQFRIHFKLVPTVSEIEGEDEVFMVDFSVGNFNLRARYNMNTHLLTRISYVACDKTLEIRNLTIEVSTNNEDQLNEIINNPRMFFANANPAAYRKYQIMCE